MGMLLYLLFFAGFFVLMMRFGCGAHVMGHGQHRDHDPQGRSYQDQANRPTGAATDLAAKPDEHAHG